MTEMKRTGMCSHCRQPVEGLVFVPVTPLRPKRLKTHQDEPEPEGLYQSKEEFLQQAEAAQAARDGAARDAVSGGRVQRRNPLQLPAETAEATSGRLRDWRAQVRRGLNAPGAASRRSQTGAAGRPAPSLRRVCSGKGWVLHGLLLEYSDGVRTGFFVENDGSPLPLSDNAALLRRGGVWQVAGLCGVGR